MSHVPFMAQMMQQVLAPDCVGAGDIPNIAGVYSVSDPGLLLSVGPPQLGGFPVQGPHVINMVSDSTGTDYYLTIGSSVPGVVQIPAGRTYVFEMWVYVPSGQSGVFFNDARAIVSWADPGAHTLTATSSAYDTWQRFRLQPLVLPGLTRFSIFIYHRGGTVPSPGGIIYVDKLSLIERTGNFVEGYGSRAADARLFADRMWNHEMSTTHRSQLGI